MRFPRDSTEFDRSLNFVDAIFGFSVTLLVTTLDVPPADSWRSLHDLMGSGLGHQLLAVAISFAVLTGFWRTNHRAISTFQALDGVALRVLIYLVALVIFLPFTTKAISDPDPDNLPLPTAIYAVNVAAVTLVSVLLVLVGRWRGLTDPNLVLAEQISGGLVVAAVFLASIPVAYRFGPDNGKWFWLSLLLLGPLVDLVVKRATRRRSQPASGSG